MKKFSKAVSILLAVMIIFQFSFVAQADDLPEQYDSRDLGLVTNVEHQGGTNLCWAYATIAASETAILKAKLWDDPQTLNLDEYQLGEGYFARNDDPLHNSTGDGNYPWLTGSAITNGGYIKNAAMFLSTGLGPMHRSSIPEIVYDESVYLDYDLSAYRLKNAIFIPENNVEALKKAVIKYGAVALADDWETHAITLIGYDDTYSKDNFNSEYHDVEIVNDGRFIIKDSYGTENYDNGYRNIPYDHITNNRFNAAVAYEYMPLDSYQYNYFYDGSGATLFSSFSAQKGQAANIFEAKMGTEEKAEYVKYASVAIYSAGSTSMDCEVQIYTDIQDETDPTSGTPMLETPQKISVEYPGIYTIELDTPVEIEKGTKFSVVETVTSTAGRNVGYYRTRTYSSVGATEVSAANQSFYRSGDSGAWNDIYKTMGNNSVIRIKAQTILVDREEEPEPVNYDVQALGASLRVADGGLRLGFRYDKSQNENVDEYGFVYSQSYIGDLTVDTNGAKVVKASKTAEEDGYVNYNLVFTGIPKSAYSQNVYAKAYVKIDGEYYYSDMLERSFNGVATAILNDDDVSQSIKNQINNLLN